MSRSIRVLLAAAGLIVLASFVGAVRLPRATPETYRKYFDSVYRHPFGAFNKAPNALVAATAATLTPGRALDVAMGEGRNAILLASEGWDVTGFDISGEALRQAQAHAASAGVAIKTVRASSESFDYGRERWDLIVFSYAFAPIGDPEYMRRIYESLKPGGYVVFEHYLREASEVPGAPERGELPAIFARFHVLRHEEIEARGDWLFGRRAPLARLVARK